MTRQRNSPPSSSPPHVPHRPSPDLAFILHPSSLIHATDGDTFWLDSQDERIRMWGLDAPETDTPGGSQATAYLSGLISGQQLTCLQRDIDRYGRIVGQCFLSDGRDITAVMIASGTAQEFCRYSRNHYRTC